MLLQVVCTGHSPVCSTTWIAQKVHSFFFGVVGWGVFGEVGGDGPCFRR